MSATFFSADQMGAAQTAPYREGISAAARPLVGVDARYESKRSFRQQITAERVRELFAYDAETGVLTNKVGRSGARGVGSIAGHLNKQSGYWTVRADNVLYQGHRLVWLHHYGAWPSQHIDHINGDRSDNRIANLRDVSHQTNAANRTKAVSGTGVVGVTADRWGFRASITVNGKTKNLGTYATCDDARQVYLAAKQELHSA